MKKVKIMMATILLGTLLIPSVTSAAEISDGTGVSEVRYNQADTYSVVIPDSITLGTAKDYEYIVAVKGDISGNSKITVTPDPTITMVEQARVDQKSDVVGTVTLSKQSWTQSEINDQTYVQTTGKVSVPKLTSGTWKGQFHFVIQNQKMG
ncbi:hypothetical protein [Massilicoli timonensis]|uniref:hypothetical protein n=1 Tax=Massilicoli timonensis TaxID=2015901 RepID=UPI00248C0EFC|nr:hypothetical protein [Massilicoli timonensis]